MAHSRSAWESSAPDKVPTPTTKQPVTRNDGVRDAGEQQPKSQTWSIPAECPRCHGLRVEPDNAITVNSELIVVYVRCCDCAHMWTVQRRGPLVRRSPDRRHRNPRRKMRNNG